MRAALILAMAMAAAPAGAAQPGAAAGPPAVSDAEAETPEALVQRQLEAYNAWDVEAFAATYSDDVALYELGLGETKPFSTGAAPLREQYAGFFAKVKPRVEVVQRIVMGPFVVDREKGHFGGEKIEAAAIYLVDGGRIRRVWFADAGFKGGDAADAAAVADKVRAAQGEEVAALMAPDHKLGALSIESPGWNAVKLPDAPPSARMVAGPFVIDRHGDEMLVVRLVRDGKVARTWVASP